MKQTEHPHILKRSIQNSVAPLLRCQRGDMRLVLKIFLGSVATLTLLATAIQPTYGVVNGVTAVGSDFAVALVNRLAPTSSLCSAAYLRPKVVITAAHCVIRNGGRAGEFGVPIGDLFVSQPGVDLKTVQSQRSIVKVLKIWTHPEYYARWEPEKGLMETQVHDIAFLFLETELNGPHVDRVATEAEIRRYRGGLFEGYHIGYGCLGRKNNDLLSNNGLPFRADGMKGTTKLAGHIPDPSNYIITESRPGQSICPGDSGSPLLADIEGETVYLATLFAGGGWDRILNGQPDLRGDALATTVWPYLTYLEEEWNAYLIEADELKARAKAALEEQAKKLAQLKIVKNKARKAGTLYVSPGCHATGINAELQVFKNGRWQRLAGVRAWEKVSSCPSSNPVTAWTSAKPPAKSKLRWRYWVVGAWDVTSDVFRSRR